MKFIWFKSDGGDVLEDGGIIVADSESEARDKLYEEYGYNCYASFISFMDLDEELNYADDNSQCISLFNLFDKQK